MSVNGYFLTLLIYNDQVSVGASALAAPWGDLGLRPVQLYSKPVKPVQLHPLPPPTHTTWMMYSLPLSLPCNSSITTLSLHFTVFEHGKCVSSVCSFVSSSGNSFNYTFKSFLLFSFLFVFLLEFLQFSTWLHFLLVVSLARPLQCPGKTFKLANKINKRPISLLVFLLLLWIDLLAGKNFNNVYFYPSIFHQTWILDTVLW